MNDKSDSEAGAFWTFTLGLYTEQGVQRAVISLQDQHGADVNILFWCVWVAATGRGRLDEARFRRAEAALDGWKREVTLPLRRIRDQIKAIPDIARQPGAGECRAKVLAAEIESERVTQALLEELAPAERPAREGNPALDAGTSLRAYAAHLSLDMKESKAPLLVLLKAAFPAQMGSELEKSLAG